MHIFKILAIFLLLVTPVKAQNTPPQLSTFLTAMELHCGPTKEMIDTLIDAYGEVQVFAGIAPSRREVISLYKEPEGENWTFLLTKPNNISCLLMTGVQGVIKGIAKPKKNIKDIPISFIEE